MYLVSDECHKPVSTFDNSDDAIACVTGWTQTSNRLVQIKPISNSTMYAVVSIDSGRTLGYITEGIIHNPSVVYY